VNAQDRRSAFTLAVLYVVSVALSALYALQNPDWSVPVPLFGLQTRYHFLLVVYVIPALGGIAAVVIMPRVIAPAYLRYKNTLLKGYRDVRVRVDAQPLNIDRYFRRMTLVALFVLSVLSTVTHYVDPLLFMTQEEYDRFVVEMGFPRFAPPVTITLSGLLIPVAIGLWATSWAMEEAGIFHYYDMGTERRIQMEVEPAYLRYNNYLKGYIGLSSVVFIATVAALFIIGGEAIEAAIFTLLIPLFAVVQSIPSYLVYSVTGREYLTRGLEMLDWSPQGFE